MSTSTEPAPAPAEPPAARLPDADLSGTGTWSLTWRGVWTVATLELRQRVRSSRWIVLLVIWGLIVGLISWLVRKAAIATIGYYNDPSVMGMEGTTPSRTTETARLIQDSVGNSMFGVIVLVVLGLGALIAPALSATSINGDRTNGVLATLQTTLLSPLEIALGKLLAAWLTALALLAVALPFIIWAYVEGGTPFGRLITVLALLAVTLLVVCAIGLGFSALTARTTSSAVLTYLTVMFLGLGLPLLFAVLTPLVNVEDQVRVRQDAGMGQQIDPNTGEMLPYAPTCVEQVQTMQRVHTERIWWLLAPTPFVVVADASPAPSASIAGQYTGFDVLTEIRQGVREARLGPGDAQENWCDPDEATRLRLEREQIQRQNSLPATWPLGLAVDLGIAALFTVITVRRLRAPSRRLARGTRVA